MTTRGLSLEDRFWSKVNKTETCWEWTAASLPLGYGVIRVDKSNVRAHRLSYEMHVGPIPEGMQVDHICHNPPCVNPEHLRLATNKQNRENEGGLRATNTSGSRGVTWNKRRNKWQTQVCHNGRLHGAGHYHSFDEAVAAVKAKRLELFTHNELDRRDAA